MLIVNGLLNMKNIQNSTFFKVLFLFDKWVQSML